MEIASRVRSFFSAAFHRGRMENDMREELQFHLETYADDLMKQKGLPREEALRQARVEFGSVDNCSEGVREARGLHILDVVIRHARYAFRQFRWNPGFTLAAVATLALGIGANAAIYSIYHQALSPLPVPQPERLVNLSSPGPKSGSATTGEAGGIDHVFSYPMFKDLEKHQTVFTGLAAHCQFTANLATRGKTWIDGGSVVSGSYFPVLGVRAALGRLLSPADDRIAGEPHIVVLSYACWQNHFGGDPNVLNRTLVINGQPMTIVGVVQREFNGTVFLAKSQVFVPITMRAFMIPGIDGSDNRLQYWVFLTARLKHGISMAQAQASLNSRYRTIINEVEAPLQIGMSEQKMAWFKAKTLVLNDGMRGHAALGDRPRDQMRLMLGITMLVWIITCLNVANLLLARGAARRDEISVRLSMGASRAQVVAQLLTESCLLALFAGAAAIPVAQWTLNLIASMIPAYLTEIIQFSLSTPVLLFGAALALGAGLFFGLFPALHCTRSDLASSLKGQAGRQTGTGLASRFRTYLSTAQIALSLALLVAAGLFAKSLYNLNRVDLGLKAENIITFKISPSLNGYTPPRSLQLYERLEDEIAALPGVTGVSNSLWPLLGGMSASKEVLVQGYEMGPDTDMRTLYDAIGPTYFHTLGIQLISGREFTRSDAEGMPRVAIVNEAFVDKFNLGRNAVGKQIGWRYGQLDTEIVGLVRNAKYTDKISQAPPLVYHPYRQYFPSADLTFYIRTFGNSDSLMPAIIKLVAKIDPNLPVERLGEMPQQLRERFWADRVGSFLTTSFACLAILLTAVGLYGVLSYTVTQRTREIGLRIALGASLAQVRGMIFRQVGIMTLIGCVAGLAIAAGLARLMQSFIYFYQVRALDPTLFFGSTAIIVLVAMLAGFIPAYRASRVDPMQALRYE